VQLGRDFPLKCLDTDLLVAILRGRKEAYASAQKLDQEGNAATTSINVFELFYGANKSQLKAQNLKETEKLLARLEVLPLDKSAAKMAGEISAKLAESGRPIDFRDAMIAAIAIQNGTTILTRNTEHFLRISDLKVKSW
jgi:tRNA(fMet)-specific endonuclease VapC